MLEDLKKVLLKIIKLTLLCGVGTELDRWKYLHITELYYSELH